MMASPFTKPGNGTTITTVRAPHRDSAAGGLFQAAMDAARRLKREHRAEYERDPKAFRETVRKANARIFRLKPGPHSDPRIAVAARERAQRRAWEPLYTKFIDHYSTMSDFTRALAESGFQRKVNAYLRRHPMLKRRWRQKTAPPNPRNN